MTLAIHIIPKPAQDRVGRHTKSATDGPKPQAGELQPSHLFHLFGAGGFPGQPSILPWAQ